MSTTSSADPTATAARNAIGRPVRRCPATLGALSRIGCIIHYRANAGNQTLLRDRGSLGFRTQPRQDRRDRVLTGLRMDDDQPASEVAHLLAVIAKILARRRRRRAKEILQALRRVPLGVGSA